MYGMVNQAVKDLVVSKFGYQKWEKICVLAQIEPSDFVFMQYYPDKLTYDLVGAASQELGLDGAKILEEFGKHWVLFTAQEGYGPMMDLFGTDFKSCIKNLNNLHARMGMTMPNLTPPRFGVQELSENELVLKYYSKRAGLGPMVVGLILGLAEKYKTKVTILPGDADKDATEVYKILLAG